ncbi:MAG: hypothetical protein HC807_03690, partial [Gammaproteobacteria bacterium]|nr:hypothetical protein [Gammaproteobacteria bacterium]
MTHQMEAPRTNEALPAPVRRRLISGLGAGAVMALAGGCVAPTLAPRTIVMSDAPRVGSTWTFGYRSDWSAVAPRTLTLTICVVLLPVIVRCRILV